MTHQRAACDVASVHFRPTVRRTDRLVIMIESNDDFMLNSVLKMFNGMAVPGTVRLGQSVQYGCPGDRPSGTECTVNDVY